MTILDNPIISDGIYEDIESTDIAEVNSTKYQYPPNRYIEMLRGKKLYVIPTVWDKHH
tara:strand:- start:347 stop:520 length:174 start_codon:yes stop_codon:yes gene_type:complete